jgi:hypothetical protein
MRLPPTPSFHSDREEAAMADPVGDIIGDYRAFAAQQYDRLLGRGIDIGPYPLSQLAVRVSEWDQYAHGGRRTPTSEVSPRLANVHPRTSSPHRADPGMNPL